MKHKAALDAGNKESCLLPLLRIELRFLGRPTRSVFTAPTEQSQLRWCFQNNSKHATSVLRSSIVVKS